MAGPICLILLAAGASRRMQGPDKLALPVGGEPLLTRAARAALESRAEKIVVVLPCDSQRRLLVPRSPRLKTVENPEAANGMGASLRAGLRHIPPNTAGVLIALADMPEIRARDHDQLIRAFHQAGTGAICRLTDAGGNPGHPVLFDRRFFGPLSELQGDKGARDILKDNSDCVVLIQGEANRASLDLDTAQDWQAYRETLKDAT